MLTVHVVSHTHWDREWYHPAERFRQRLVALIDELLDDHPKAGAFVLDGQTIVLEDYLDLRPERAADLSAALRERHLEAGPWFVLADELIPGAEGLVRNLLAGKRTLRALRAEAPPVLYCPDSFGHPSALPVLARGFDKTLIIVWRGFGGPRSPSSDACRWSGADGESVLLYHLSRSGYELGATLPDDPGAARERWSRIRDQLAPRATTGATLLLNGADHHARQLHRDAALDVLRDVARPDVVIPSSLTEFSRDIGARASATQPPEVRGELRDSYGYTWTLQGTLASRTPQKRRYARRERELVRDVEPWAAWAFFHGGGSRRHLANATWRPLLLCQPHDTLCGCSVDQVARAMDGRLESVAAQAAGLREDAMLAWIGHDRDAARADRDAWKPLLVVRNRAARARSGVAIVDLTSFIADLPVGPGSRHVDVAAVMPARRLEPAGTGALQILEKAIEQERTEAPRSYPDNDAVERAIAAVWIENAPAYGIVAYPLAAPAPSSITGEQVVSVTDDSMSNGQVTARFDKAGAVALEQEGRTIRDLLEWDSRTDAGDLYTPAPRGPKLEPLLIASRFVSRGPLRAVFEQHWTLRADAEKIDVRIRFILDAGARWLRVALAGENDARDHRLRLGFHTDISAGSTVADAAFGPVERTTLRVSDEEAAVETPVTTAPLHRYVSLFGDRAGVTVFSDGLTEYESDAGTLWITLLRSVGELSRSDLPERPGHAGWPARTPEAQCIGPFQAELSVMLHGRRTPAVVDAIERASDDVLFPLVGETLRSALRMPPPRHGVSLQGAGLALSAIKESDDGQWVVLRCVNLLDQNCAGSWRLGRTVTEARLARLDETPLTPLETHDDTISFLAPPRGVVTILTR